VPAAITACSAARIWATVIKLQADCSICILLHHVAYFVGIDQIPARLPAEPSFAVFQPLTAIPSKAVNWHIECLTGVAPRGKEPLGPF
jgi:hypothetical protein